MSIQTELTRIINAKASIVSAVEGKGVTVPDGTLLDGMAALIDSIEAAGGSAKVYIEQKTFASNQTSVKITHNFGELPTIFLQLMIATSSGKHTNKARIGVGYTKDGKTHGTTAYNSSSSSNLKFTNYPPVVNYNSINDTDCTFNPCGGNTSGSYYYAGDTYLFAFVGGVQL